MLRGRHALKTYVCVRKSSSNAMGRLAWAENVITAPGRALLSKEGARGPSTGGFKREGRKVTLPFPLTGTKS